MTLVLLVVFDTCFLFLCCIVESKDPAKFCSCYCSNSYSCCICWRNRQLQCWLDSSLIRRRIEFRFLVMRYSLTSDGPNFFVRLYRKD